MPSIAELRRMYPDTTANLKDEDIVSEIARANNWELPYAAARLGYETPKSDLGKEFYAGGNRYLAGMGHVGAALGVPGAQEYATEKEARAKMLQGLSNAPHSWDEVKFGDSDKGVTNYVGQAFAGSAPYVAEAAGYALADAATGGALTPGILVRYGAVAPRVFGGGALREGASMAARREALDAGKGFARSAMIPAVTYPSSLGDVLSNQYEQSGGYDLASAAPLAAGYAGMNFGGVEGAIAGRNINNLSRGLTRSRIANAALGGAEFGAKEAGQEVGQEVFNQYARNAVDPTYDPFGDKAMDAYKESAIAAGFMGGLPGSIHGAMYKKAAPITPGAETDLLGGNGYPNQPGTAGAALAPLGPNPTPGQGQLAFPVDSEANVGTQGAPILTAGPAGVDVTGGYDIPYGIRNPYDTAGFVTGFKNGNIATMGDPQADAFGTTLDPNAGLETLQVAPAAQAQTPLAQARQAFIDAGGNAGTWTKFVSTAKLTQATPEELSDILLKRANSTNTLNSTPWEAAHEALNPRGTTNVDQENVARGQEGNGQAGQPQGAVPSREVGIAQGTQERGRVQEGRNGQGTQGLLDDQSVDFKYTPTSEHEGVVLEPQSGRGKIFTDKRGNRYVRYQTGTLESGKPTYAMIPLNKLDSLQPVNENGIETTQAVQAETQGPQAPVAVPASTAVNVAQSEQVAAQAPQASMPKVASNGQIAVNGAAVPLADVQQKVMNYIAQAEANGDSIRDAQGKLKAQEIATALGMDRGSVAVAIEGIQNRIAGAYGVTPDQVKTGLRKLNKRRDVEESTQAKLGDSPAAQDSQLDIQEAVGQDKSMQVVNSVGGSGSDTGKARLQNKNKSPAKMTEDELQESLANLIEPLRKEGKSDREIDKALKAHPVVQEMLRRQIKEAEQTEIDQERAERDEQEDELDGDLDFNQFQGKWSDEKMAAARKRAINQAIARMKGRDVPPARKPMMLSRLTKLLNGVHEGTISDGQLVNELGWLTQELMDVKASKEMAEGKDRVRGADYFRQRLLEAKRNGWISETEADFAEWMVKKNPALLDDLAIAIKTSPENSTAAGSYNPALRLVTLFKDHGPDTTAVHEILHHLERMLPHELRKPLAKEYARRLINEYKGSTGARKAYFEKVFELMANPSRKLMDEALALLEKSGDINDYQYITLSEFWAENGADLLKARFDANDSTFKRIAQFMREIVQKLKSLLNMKTDAPLIKALDHVLNGNGEFVEKNMLVNTGADTYLSYVGEKAQTVAKENIEKAKEMDAAGADQETIRLATGWFKGKYDGKWRQEVSDELAAFKEPVENLEESVLFKEPKHYRLGDVLDHPELFAAYPEAADIKFLVRKGLFDFGGLQGWFNPETNEIGVTPYADDKLGTVMHELQHWIQNKEGFATGGNANTVMDKLTDEQREKVATDLIKNLRREFVKAVENEDAANTLRKKLQDVRAEWVVWTTAYKEQSGAFDRLQNVLDELRNLKDHGAKPSQMLLDLEKTLRKEHSEKYDAAWAAEKNIRQILFGTDDYFALTDDQRSAWSHIASQKREAESIDDLRVAGEKADLTGLNKRITALQSGDPEALKNEIKKAGLAHTYYTRIAGEIEARDTSARREMSYQEREATAPYSSEDIAAEDAFVTFEKEESNSSNGPTGPNFSKKADPSTPSGFFNRLGSTIDELIANPVGTLSQLKLGWMTLEQIADRIKSTAVKQYVGVMTKMQQYSKDLIYQAAKIDQDWGKLNEAVQRNLSQVMRDATRAGFDPEADEAVNDAQEALRQRFNAMPDSAQQVYRRVRDHYQKLFDERKAIMLKAAASGALPERNRAEVEAMFKKVKGPYFPLMRIGKWYAVGMSKEMAALQAKVDDETISPEEEKRYNAMRKDKAHYITSSFDTRGQAKMFAKNMKGQYAETYFNVAKERLDNIAKSMPSLSAMQEHISAGLPESAASDIKNMLAQMYFDMAVKDDNSPLKRLMKREGIYGEEPDMRKVFATSSISMAHHVSRLKYSTDLSEALQTVNKSTKRDEGMRHVFNELVQRANLATQGDESSVIDLMVQGSYFAHLGLSPAFVLTNMTQVPMITAPWLGARYGFGKVTGALSQAYADAAKIVIGTVSKDGWRAEYDWNRLFKEGSNEDKLLKELLDRNLLDITMEHDLGAVGRATSTKTGRKINDAVRWSSMPVRASEAANRLVTGLAAYRLEMSKSGNHERAVEMAAKAISETQLNYSALNAPRYMQSVMGSKAIAKLMFQFRKYQQGMVYLITKSAYDAVKGGTKQEKAEAAKTLFGLLTTTGLMAGATGLPFAGSAFWLASVIGGMFGDDDEPFDAEIWFRNYLADLLGDDAARAVSKGLPTLMGVDLSGNVGLGNIGMPFPYMRDGKKPSEGLANMLVAAAGAPFETMQTVVDGISELMAGDFIKGAEHVIPLKAAKNLVKAYRYSSDGMTDNKGNIILPPENFSPWDLAIRSAGFTNVKESDYYAANNAMQKAKQAATDVRQKLLREYANARLAGEDVADFQGWIADFNSRHPEKGVRIDQSSLLKAVTARRNLAKDRTETGLRRDKYMKPYLDEARFADGE